MSERFLVTGALGCLGAWTVRGLLDEDVHVIGIDKTTDSRRLQAIVPARDLERATILQGDITDRSFLQQVVDEHEITHIIHLAALLMPQIEQDAVRGAMVNLVGTTCVFETVKASRDRVRSLVYASSIAVFGASDADQHGRVSDDSPASPTSYYGAHKLSNEILARVYWNHAQISSIGLRPYVIFGPGRDIGLTASPTLAMRAAALGTSYTIPYGGTAVYHYAPDAARAFITASRTAVSGAETLNLPGHAIHMREIVAAIGRAVPNAVDRISFDDIQLPLPERFYRERFADVVGPVELTTLDGAVESTIDYFTRQRP